jgi:pilus assembly protein FimV
MKHSPSGVTVPNTAKRNPFKATVLAAALAILPLASHAAGLGKITVLSALGQPLKAELEVTATRDEALSLVARVASIEAFRQAGIEYVPALVNLRFSKEIKERGWPTLRRTQHRPTLERAVHRYVGGAELGFGASGS